MRYSSAITFLYYNDFSYGIGFLENVLQLDLAMDQGFARIYQVNEKAFLGIVQSKDGSELPGNTLVSLSTAKLEEEYQRVRQSEVHELSELKHFDSIPLTSFFFNDLEGYKFEIQEF